eukprot:m.143711 g.143711  ORF g.143711 m.143711 type:complete len:102 (+) comp30332_c2_seq1:129-434(+)
MCVFVFIQIHPLNDKKPSMCFDVQDTKEEEDHQKCAKEKKEEKERKRKRKKETEKEKRKKKKRKKKKEKDKKKKNPKEPKPKPYIEHRVYACYLAFKQGIF